MNTPARDVIACDQNHDRAGRSRNGVTGHHSDRTRSQATIALMIPDRVDIQASQSAPLCAILPRKAGNGAEPQTGWGQS